MRAVVLMMVLGCRPAQPAAPLGGSGDDGAGELASASATLMTADGSGADPFAPRRRRRDADAFGGNVYGKYVVPAWQAPTDVHRTYPRHQQQAGLAGAIEGRITWRGALPGKHTTACGQQQLVHVGEDRGIADVVILIESVKVGRMMPTDGHTPQIGGSLVKRNCAWLPTAQIVTPLPASLTIHSDAAKTGVRVATPTTARTFTLQEGGRASIPMELGFTRVEADDGSLAAAWVIATDAPYYALTDDHGRFRIDELAAGSYELTIWHPPLPNDTTPLTYGQPIVLKRTVTVGKAPARLDVAIGR